MKTKNQKVGIVSNKDIAFCRKHLKNFKKSVLNNHRANHLSLLPIPESRVLELARQFGLSFDDHHFNYRFSDYHSENTTFCFGFDILVTPKKGDCVAVLDTIGNYVNFAKAVKIKSYDELLKGVSQKKRERLNLVYSF